jgi:hypothetical protein
MPGFLMGDDPSPVRAGLRESLGRLLELDFDNLLFVHGEPQIGGGRVKPVTDRVAEDIREHSD